MFMLREFFEFSVRDAVNVQLARSTFAALLAACPLDIYRRYTEQGGRVKN